MTVLDRLGQLLWASVVFVVAVWTGLMGVYWMSEHVEERSTKEAQPVFGSVGIALAAWLGFEVWRLIRGPGPARWPASVRVPIPLAIWLLWTFAAFMAGTSD